MEVDQGVHNIAGVGRAEVRREKPIDAKGVHGDVRVIPSTNWYTSLDSTTKEAIRILPYRNKGTQKI